MQSKSKSNVRLAFCSFRDVLDFLFLLYCVHVFGLLIQIVLI